MCVFAFAFPFLCLRWVSQVIQSSAHGLIDLVWRGESDETITTQRTHMVERETETDKKVGGLPCLCLSLSLSVQLCLPRTQSGRDAVCCSLRCASRQRRLRGSQRETHSKNTPAGSRLTFTHMQWLMIVQANQPDWPAVRVCGKRRCWLN